VSIHKDSTNSICDS